MFATGAALVFGGMCSMICSIPWLGDISNPLASSKERGVCKLIGVSMSFGGLLSVVVGVLLVLLG